MSWNPFRRRRNADRTLWLTCRTCDHDLNGDGDSFVEDTGDAWVYVCASCGARSVFSLAYPVPALVSHEAGGVR